MDDPSSQAVLSRPVLKLNKSFVAYGVTTVEKALVAICKGRAEAVNHTDVYSYETYSWGDWSKLLATEHDVLVRSSHEAFVAPQVIRMLDFKAMPKRGVTCNRLNVCKRDGWKCQYCGTKVTGPTMTLDHVIPRTQGGKSEWGNLVTSCYECNQKKGGRTPRQANMVLLSKPVKPEWDAGFAIHVAKFSSWAKFLDVAYWNVPLQT